MNAESLLRAGDLEACKKQLFTEIKQDPSNVKLRIFLFQLSCINADWQRAASQLEVLRDLDDTTLALVNSYGQLLECEQMREAVIKGKTAPLCFGEPSDWMAYYIQAFQAYAQGNTEEAFNLINQGADIAPAISGTINGDQPFEWLSDGDVRFGPSIEVILNGNYYWLPLENVSKLEFEKVEDLRDMVWRPVNLTLKNKGKLIAFVPSRYPLQASDTDAQRLARTCEWQEPLENFYVGQGQRIFISNDAEYPLLNIESIEFNVE